MTRKELEPFLPKWRIGALSLKEFHSLSIEEKDKHVQYIAQIPEQERSDSDIYFLRYYSSVPESSENFFKL